MAELAARWLYVEGVVLVRPGKAADIDDAVSLYERSNLARRQGAWPGQAARVDHVRERLRDPDTWLLVATEGPEMVAMTSARALREQDGEGAVIPGGCFLGFMYVAPERWGRGIGGALLDAVLAEAERRLQPRIHLLTHPDNERSQRLYRSRGFSPTGRSGDGQEEWVRAPGIPS
ncbi:MAG TPA: GNAT family N-acetyltransferase [Streptosporangiaceae bacterium]|nr:GNAT family N-acetyltransferase [Streptosporangiaceae bacterium]